MKSVGSLLKEMVMGFSFKWTLADTVVASILSVAGLPFWITAAGWFSAPPRMWLWAVGGSVVSGVVLAILFRLRQFGGNAPGRD